MIRMKFDDDGGFSLLEVIISIAALSFISVFILQMFMVSSNVNSRARDVDIATAEAISAIENFKSRSDINEYLGTFNDGDVFVEDVPQNVGFVYYYDKGWNELVGGMPNDAYYSLSINITRDTDADSTGYGNSGNMYQIEVNVSDVSYADSERSLVMLKTKKYFPMSYAGGL